MTSHMTAEAVISPEVHLADLIHRRVGNRVRGLRVLVRPDGLVLQGRAANYHAKQVAQQAAMEVTPLPILANEIEVAA